MPKYIKGNIARDISHLQQIIDKLVQEGGCKIFPDDVSDPVNTEQGAEIAKKPPLVCNRFDVNVPIYPVCIGYKCWDGKEDSDADTEI